MRSPSPCRSHAGVVALALAIGLLLAASTAGALVSGRAASAATNDAITKRTPALSLGAAASASVPSVNAGATANDALTTRVLGELQTFTQWLAANRAKGSVSGFAWPYEDSEKWGALAEKWYAVADANNLWTLQFTAGPYSMYGQPPYHLLVYRRAASPDGGGPLAVAGPQAAVLEAHRSTTRYRRGIVISGGDWTILDYDPNSDFSNKNPGTYGGDWGTGGWRYETKESYAYLKSRGIDTVGINVRWERLQPTLFGPLDAAELARLQATISAAGSVGLRVVLTLHNYGEYYLYPHGRVTVGDARLPAEALADVWVRMSKVFRRDSNVVAYSLMNEPHDLDSHILDDSGRDVTGARLWEVASQRTVVAIRRASDKKLLLVPGYNYSHLDTWVRDHPRGWINDPARNFLYDAHQYWDAGGGAAFRLSYDEENTLAAAAG
jgi:hypothetical protein